jgi:hypothetical protein
MYTPDLPPLRTSQFFMYTNLIPIQAFTINCHATIIAIAILSFPGLMVRVLLVFGGQGQLSCHWGDANMELFRTYFDSTCLSTSVLMPTPKVVSLKIRMLQIHLAVGAFARSERTSTAS